MGKNKKVKKIFFYAMVICFLAINLFPFWIMLMTSFKGSSEAISTTPNILSIFLIQRFFHLSTILRIALLFRCLHLLSL